MKLFVESKSKGFTLIEVLVTLIILAVSLLALAGLMATTAKNNSYGGHMTEAATLAQDKLEEFRANQWQQIIPTTGGPQTEQKPGSAGINYTRNWSVAINPLNANLKQITITVNWNDRVNHSISLLSMLSQ